MSTDGNDDGDDTDDLADLLIAFEQEISMVRIVENIFLPSQLTVRAEILPTDAETGRGLHGEAAEDYEVAFAKVRFWMENILNRCVAFCRTNETALKMMLTSDGRNNSGNLLMLTPEEPSDENLAVLLQAKMTALAGGRLVFGAVEVKSNNLTGLRFTFVGDSGDLLPSMEEWIGPRSYFDQPWWNRDDASTLDVAPAPEADLDDKPAWAFSLDFIAKAIRPSQDVVLRPEFKPTVIEGGQKDDDPE